MAHDIRPHATPDFLAVDPHGAGNVGQVQFAPCTGTTAAEHATGVEKIVGNQAEDPEIAVVGIAIVDQFHGRHDRSHRIGHRLAIKGSPFGKQVGAKPDGDLAFDTEPLVVGGADPRRGATVDRCRGDSAGAGLADVQVVLHDRRRTADLAAGEGPEPLRRELRMQEILDLIAVFLGFGTDFRRQPVHPDPVKSAPEQFVCCGLGRPPSHLASPIACLPPAVRA